MKKISILFIYLLSFISGTAQQMSNKTFYRDTIHALLNSTVRKVPFFNIRFTGAPALLIVYGLGSLQINELKILNLEVKEEITEHHAGFKTNTDDYLQFAPAAASFMLQSAGIKGKHNLKDKAIIYSAGLLIMTSVVYSLKSVTHKIRPDASSYSSFPSGHTANAFMGAAFLAAEYKDQSPWIGYAGYATAAGTGIMRMYNNKHWLADVLTGAGIGILSTKLSYWIYTKIEKKRALKNLRNSRVIL